MHSDMGDERGIRLRCICLGDAALRGSRMSARGRCGKGSESRIARSSLSNARSSVCATTRCLRIIITIRQKKKKQSPHPLLQYLLALTAPHPLLQYLLPTKYRGVTRHITCSHGARIAPAAQVHLLPSAGAQHKNQYCSPASAGHPAAVSLQRSPTPVSPGC